MKRNEIARTEPAEWLWRASKEYNVEGFARIPIGEGILANPTTAGSP